MSVAQTAPRFVKTAGNGIVTAFNFTWKIYSKTDITAYKVSALDVYTLGVVDVDYTVSFDTDAETGTVTWAVAPVSGGFSVIIGDAMPLTQASAYPREGVTPAATQKNAIDKLTILTQQLRDKLARSPLQPLTPVNPDPIEIELPVDGKGLRWRDDGGTFVIESTLNDPDEAGTAAAAAAASAAAASASAASAAASAAAAAASAFVYAEGTYAAKPATPAMRTFYYSTDQDQLELYIPTAGRWMLLG